MAPYRPTWEGGRILAERHPKSAYGTRLVVVVLVSLLLAGCGRSTSVGTYSISGRVTRASDNSGLDRITLQFSGGLGTATTAGGGHWHKDGLKGTVTVTPTGQEWTFNPPNRTVSSSASDVNFQASPAGTYSVSGYVRDNLGNAVKDVLIEFDKGFGSTNTGADGKWTKSGLSGTVMATPKKDGWTFSPASCAVDGAASDVDFTGTYAVSGRVTGSGGAGIADALLFLGSGFGTARTASDGSWNATGLSGNVTVTPAKAGLVFTPETVTVSGSSSSVNFTGSPATNTYSVSGRVTDSSDGNGVYAVSFTFSGGFGRAQSDVGGYWSKSELYGTVTITPSRPGWVFQPESRTVTGASDVVDFVGSRSGGSASEGGDK